MEEDLMQKNINDEVLKETEVKVEGINDKKIDVDASEKNKTAAENRKNSLFLDQTNTMIIGRKGSAKTTLGWTFAEKIHRISGRKIYMFNHPRPDLIIKANLPFEVTNITKLDALFNVTDGVVLVDEAQEVFNFLEKKVNEELKSLLSRSRQNNTCFIFICHNSYFLNRSLFSFVDIKIIKEVNEKHWELERVHMKKLYEHLHIFGKENFFIDSDYAKGYQMFQKPKWWTEDLSLAYGKASKKEDFFG
jgi:hypothetical protein